LRVIVTVGVVVDAVVNNHPVIVLFWLLLIVIAFCPTICLLAILLLLELLRTKIPLVFAIRLNVLFVDALSSTQLVLLDTCVPENELK